MVTVCVFSPLGQLTLTQDGTSIPTDGSGRFLITDLNIVTTNGANESNAVLCSLPGSSSRNSDWYVHPDSRTTNDGFRVEDIRMSDNDGWGRNRGDGVVRLWRNEDNALEGVFTCRFPDANPNTVHLGMYYRSKLYYICTSSLHVQHHNYNYIIHGSEKCL